jgi:hypothetical protein
MWKDPIVEKIHKIRLQIERECENDFEKIYDKALEVQEAHKKRLITRPLKIEE